MEVDISKIPKEEFDRRSRIVKIAGQIIDEIEIAFDNPLFSVVVGGRDLGLQLKLGGDMPYNGEFSNGKPALLGGGLSIQVPVRNTNAIKIINTTGKKNGFWVKAFYLDSNISTPTPTST